MAQIARESVRDIDRRVRNTEQGPTERHPRLGPLQARLRMRQHGGIECAGALQCPQGQRRIAERAAHIHIVACARGIAAQGARRVDPAQHGDRDRQRSGRRIAADEFASVSIAEREQAACERIEPGLIAGTRRRQGDGQRERERLGAHRGEIAEIHRQAFVPQCLGIDIGKEMPPFDQHVGRDGQRAADLKQGAIVADAQQRAAHRRIGTAREATSDEFEFTHRAGDAVRLQPRGLNSVARKRAATLSSTPLTYLNPSVPPKDLVNSTASLMTTRYGTSR